MNEVIADKKDINDKIFRNDFKYQNPSFLLKDLIRVNQAKNEQLVNNINDGLKDLRNSINRKKILKMKKTSSTLEHNKIIYHTQKEITKNVYNNIMNLIKL